jgi:hypothetical protein
MLIVQQLPRCHVIKKEPYPFTFLKAVGSLSKLKKKNMYQHRSNIFEFKRIKLIFRKKKKKGNHFFQEKITKETMSLKLPLRAYLLPPVN